MSNQYAEIPESEPKESKILLTQEDANLIVDEIEVVNPDMIDAMIFSVVAATKLGAVGLFGDVPFDFEFDDFVAKRRLNWDRKE